MNVSLMRLLPKHIDATWSPGYSFRRDCLHRWVDVTEMQDADRRERCMVCGETRMVPRS